MCNSFFDGGADWLPPDVSLAVERLPLNKELIHCGYCTGLFLKVLPFFDRCTEESKVCLWININKQDLLAEVLRERTADVISGCCLGNATLLMNAITFAVMSPIHRLAHGGLALNTLMAPALPVEILELPRVRCQFNRIENRRIVVLGLVDPGRDRPHPHQLRRERAHLGGKETSCTLHVEPALRNLVAIL
jgi:hypothetical protein